MKYRTKLLSRLLCICMFVPLLTACGSQKDSLDEYVEPKVIFEPYDYDAETDDKFALTTTAVLTMVKDKVLSTAKSKATAYAKNLGNKVVTKATDWLKSKLLYCLEIEPSPEPPQYSSTDVYNKLTTIENDIKDMKESLDILKNQVSDNQYYIKYTAFVNNLSDIRNYTETRFNSLETLNGMPEDSVSDYSELAKSIENSLRGSGDYSVPIEQQTEISTKALNYGNAILAEETPSTYLNSYGIFNIIRYFAERETPWAHQRKDIEDTYLSSIIYSYRNAHALAIFDYAYQISALGVEEIYLSPDGIVIAFKYSENGTNAKWYYNAYPYQENELITKYKTIFDNFSETPVSITDIKSGIYPKLVFLFGYYKQHQAQYNTILRKFDEFTRKDNEKYFVLETQNNRQYEIDLFGGSSYPSGKSYYGDSSNSGFISWDSNSKEYTIDFDKFKNCKKSEFLEFVELIKPYAGDKSLYDYLRFVGFQVPKADGLNALALGIETKKDDEYDNKLQSNARFPRNFIIYWIDINTKVNSISSSSFCKTWYSASMYMGGSCNNKPQWRDYWNMSERTLKYGGGESYSKPKYFLSLHGLSTSSLSGKIGRGSINTSW